MTGFLRELYADLLAYEQNRPRSLQVEIGGSGLFGCRAEHVLRLNAVPQSDPRMSWEAFVGSAIDHRIGEVRLSLHPELVVQEQLAYRGVKFTVDEYSPSEKILRDWKSKNSAADCAKAVRWMEQSLYDAPAKRAQLHGGAAALIEAGREVDTIQLVFLPRAGAFDGARLFTEPFSREWADKGVEWAAEVVALAEHHRQTDPDMHLEYLQDKSPEFCWKFCPQVSNCRGPW